MFVLGIRNINYKGKFKKAYKRLDTRIQEEVDSTLKDLLKNPIPRGRRVKKMQGHHNPEIWEARVNDNFRITFEIEGDTAILRNVDTHNLLYKNP